MDTKDKRIAELESCLRECWGVTMLAATEIDNPRLRAAFARVDEQCRKTGLLAREGMEFLETAKTE